MKSLAIDIHAHALIEEVEKAVRQEQGWRREMEQTTRLTGEASLQHNRQLMTNQWMPGLTRVETRIAAMDKMAIDVQGVSVVPTQYHYWADRSTSPRNWSQSPISESPRYVRRGPTGWLGSASPRCNIPTSRLPNWSARFMNCT